MANKVTKEYPLSLNIPKDCLECGFLVEENDEIHCAMENSCKELKKWIKERDEQIRADERAKVLEKLRLLMKDRADDCSDIPNMFDKGYYKAYEHMCEEIEQLKGQRDE